MRAGFAVLAIGALSLLAWKRPAPSPSIAIGEDAGLALAFVPKASAAARPAIPVRQDGPRYVLHGSQDVDQLRAEPPRLNAANGLREDILSRGEFPAIETPHLRLAISEGPAGHAALFVTLVRRAADGPGLFISRTGERGRIDSKFGPVETVETTLKALSRDGGSRMCTGFVTRPPARVNIDGWLCAPLGQPPEPRAITCALDNLTRNGQASSAWDDAPGDVQAAARAAAECGTASFVASQTEWIGGGRPRNEAKLRRTAQARP